MPLQHKHPVFGCRKIHLRSAQRMRSAPQEGTHSCSGCGEPGWVTLGPELPRTPAAASTPDSKPSGDHVSRYDTIAARQAQLIQDLSDVEASPGDLSAVLRPPHGAYRVNAEYTELAEREHGLREALAGVGKTFVDDDAGGPVADPSTALAHLRQPVASRAVIGQAQGMLMERHELTADGAFARVPEMSKRSHRRIDTVALEMCRGRCRSRDARRVTHG